MEIPNLEAGEDHEEPLGEAGQEVFRGIIGKIGWLGGVSRPDLAFDPVELSSKFGEATHGDLKSAVKVAKKLKLEDTVMKFPNLGDVKDWVI